MCTCGGFVLMFGKTNTVFQVRGTQWKGLEIKSEYVVIMAVIRIQLHLIWDYKCYWGKIATKRYNVNKS